MTAIGFALFVVGFFGMKFLTTNRITAADYFFGFVIVVGFTGLLLGITRWLWMVMP